ncbi:class D sortase [Anoxybacteroides tepidamans]|uniref:class D sortase n=1 Tax=Anoxybacteroides tepidamans TaxID=265948 RepID=UPI000487345C|nr:class D sortase [Anoxybacillus tepidamans]
MRKQRLVRILGISFIAVGVALTSLYGYKWIKGVSAVKPMPKEAAAPAPTVPETTQEVIYPRQPKTGEHIGELIIPKLNAILPIYHGTNEDELEKGVGHYAGSVLPGQQDNCVLAGHRDTVFRKLGEVGKGDLLIVKTMAGEFTYKVRKVRIVDADDRTVIRPKPRATLTVSTCYPFHYIGAAPKRYILVANLVKTTK